MVHAAYDEVLDRVVALKMLRTDRSSAAVVGRFIREAKALARVAHANIVQIYDVSTSAGRVFLAMEYVRGRTLRQQLAEAEPGAPCQRIVDLFVAAGRGLAEVHRAGLVHRDFKPDNVMVGEDGRVLLLDFGLIGDSGSDTAAEPDERRIAALDLTVTGSVLGTPAYMAPEQHRGARISLHGARLDEAPVDDSPAARAARSLIVGEPLAALAALGDDTDASPRHALLAMLAYDALQDVAGMTRTAALALPGLDDADLLHLLRTRPGLAPTLRAATGPRALRLLAETWPGLARHHFDDPAVQQAMLAALAGIEATAVPDASTRRALRALLHARAMIRSQLGDTTLARRDFEAALAALGDEPDDSAGPQRAETHLALALLLAGADPSAALAHAVRAVASDGAPARVRDRLRREPALAERITHDPAWQSLVADR